MKNYGIIAYGKRNIEAVVRLGNFLTDLRETGENPVQSISTV